MNIIEQFWKWKRAIRKRRETIAKTISIALIVALVVVVGVTAFNVYKNDARRAAAANQEGDTNSIKAINKYDYGPEGFQKVAENESLILSADFTTGEIEITEKASGMKWYSNPQDREDDPMVKSNTLRKNKLNSQIHIKFLDLEKAMFLDYDNYSGSIKKGRMEHEFVENGIKFVFGFPTANVYIPVQYTLCKDGFKAEILTGEIKSVGDNPFMIDSISLLPYFGAGGVADEGYLFVPDGSGALIDYNNNKQNMQTYSAPVYGRNITVEKLKEESIRERNSLPVFGAKKNDHAFIGVITAGETCSTISAATSMTDCSYNYVYASAALSEYSLLVAANANFGFQQSHTIDYKQDLLDGGNYTVQYFFMDGEDADYIGMSEAYRDYLDGNNLLKDSALTDKKYMVLDLIGAVSIEKYVMGVKKPVVTALTTYNEVCDIVKDLKAQGVENLIINYIGAQDGGLKNKLYDKVSPESVLGSRKEFKNMISYLEQEGVLLFLELNPVDLYENGNGYTENGHSVKTFFDKYAFQYLYDLDIGKNVAGSRWHLLRPRLVAKLTNDFVASAVDWNVNNISLDRLGQDVYSDYAKDGNYISRKDVLELWKQTLKNVDEKTSTLMVHGGNAYCLPYADVITDVSDDCSNYDIQDQGVPFYQIAFQDRLLLTASGINTTVDYEQAFLKAIETGCSLKYNMICGDVSQLVGTAYNTMVSYSYDYWKAVAVEEYLELQTIASELAGKQIVDHGYVDTDVTRTVYDTTEVIVNYRNEAYTYNDMVVEARDYLIISGGAK